MTPAKLNLFFSFYPYGGGGISMEHPSIREWWGATLLQAKADERVGTIHSQSFSDTPITMTRCNAVLTARQAKADVLVMCDSDMHPDLYPYTPRFWDSSFEFLYQRKMRNKMTVIGAPYCGPPPNECCYVFQWSTKESHHAGTDISLSMYPREQATQMAGIQPCAGLPTGLIMFDMDIFKVTDPEHEYKRLLQTHDHKTALALTKPWFYYEWENMYQAQKASTEDVTCTRDMGLAVQEKFGYNPMFCNWDCWAGHYKPKCVGKPQIVTSDMVNEKYRNAVLANRKSDEKMVQIDGLSGLNRIGADMFAQEHVNGQG